MMYVVTYATESGDEGVAKVYSREPTEAHLTALAKRMFPEELEEDCGVIYSSVSFQVHPVKRRSPLPQPCCTPFDWP